MTNALAGETSPYLLQHQHNPVAWRPWSPATLDLARRLDRPLLVSIGYSSCHWCHVMERESFEDAATAAVMNEHFVCVKVDREERPDVDALYMEAVQAMTGQGGWPLNVFLTPDQVPFYGGTYFPPLASHGRPAWTQILLAIAEAWTERREEIRTDATRAAAQLQGGALLEASDAPLTSSLLDAAVAGLTTSFDSVNGGWGAMPKFPAASAIEFLLARGQAPMALQSLRAMASGGIFDQVGGGFSRYSVDPSWTVPHFEKMLYDNALLARAYLHGWLVSGDKVLRRTCEETLDWVLREMRAGDGGFFSALDADSEGVEGKFYVWTLAELTAALGPDAQAAIAWFGATADGNFDEGPAGANVLESRGAEPGPETRARIRAHLLAARAERVRPATDDKRLTSWNALMIAALADAGATLERPDYLAAARDAATFVLDRLRDADGRLLRTYNRGEAKIGGFLEDHAFLLEALLALYEATFEERWFTAARDLADTILERFEDRAHGGFFSTAHDGERLITRRKELDEQPIPSGGSSAANGLIRLARLTGDQRYEAAALGHLRLIHPLTATHPSAFSHTLRAIDLYLGPTREIALVGEDTATLAAAVRAAFRPRIVLAGGPGGATAVPLLEGRPPSGAGATAYVCEGFACRQPVTRADDLIALLNA